MSKLFSFSCIVTVIVVAFLIAFLLPLLIHAQVDTTAYESKAGVADVAEADPGLFLMMMLLLMAAVITVLLLMIISAIFAGVIAAMIAAGILSISAFMAWYKKSVYAGVKWFVYLSFAIAGLGAGLLAGLTVNHFRDYEGSQSEMLLWCLPAGIAGGLAAAWVIIKIGNILYRKIAALR